MNYINHKNLENINDFSNISYEVSSKRDSEDPMLFHFSASLDNESEVSFVVTFDYHAVTERVTNVDSSLDSELSYSSIISLRIAAEAIFDGIEQVLLCDESTLEETEPYFYCNDYEESDTNLKLFSKVK